MKQNYQKMLEDVIAQNEKEKKCRHCFCTVVVHPAAPIVWNICRSILK